MQQIRHIIPRIGVILTGSYNSAGFLMNKHTQCEKINLTFFKCHFKQVITRNNTWYITIKRAGGNGEVLKGDEEALKGNVIRR